MSGERPRFEPGLVLAQVSMRVIVPMLGGAILGLVADAMARTSPQFVLIGLAGGTLVSIVWLRGFIVSNAERIRQQDASAAAGSERGEHEHTTTERP
ncbi:MAG: hypothetical protein IT341_05090 [Chloroflexi bacterium]|nr:hypothetical protein [Chloroflexota bacterium]